jgi:ABC-type spermidine/putrescine transport system permease subunit II
MRLRLAVLALLAFMTLPTVVVIAVSFNPTAILSFPRPASPGAGT